MDVTLNKGILRTGAVVQIAGVGAVTGFQISNFAQMIGTKSYKVRKIMVRNTGAGNVALLVGTGLAGVFVAAMPGFMTVNGLDSEWTEVDIPDVEFAADITLQCPTWVAGTLDCQLTVEEIG